MKNSPSYKQRSLKDSRIRIYFIASLKWPHWWPTTASHKEKLEAARDTNGDQFFSESFTLQLLVLVCSVHTRRWRETFLFTPWESPTLSLAVTCNCSKNNILKALCWSAGFEHQPLNLQSPCPPPPDKYTLFLLSNKSLGTCIDFTTNCIQGIECKIDLVVLQKGARSTLVRGWHSRAAQGAAQGSACQRGDELSWGLLLVASQHFRVLQGYVLAVLQWCGKALSIQSE